MSTLDEPLRRALFEFVSRSAVPVSRDDAAAAFGAARATVAFHLDRLADEGFLEVRFKRLTGRAGPGAGRPSKLYTRAAGEVHVMVPERRYDFAAELLVAAVEESTRTGEPVGKALRRVVLDAGRRLGSAAGSLERVLEEEGFEPRPDSDAIVLGNCPFHRLAQQHTETVCRLNLQLLRGVAEGANDHDHDMQLDPSVGRCCVRVVPRPPRSGSPASPGQPSRAAAPVPQAEGTP